MIAAQYRRACQRIPILKCRGLILAKYGLVPCRPATVPQGMNVWSVALPNLLRGHHDFKPRPSGGLARAGARAARRRLIVRAALSKKVSDA